MGIFSWILLGGIAGWIASMLMHTRGSQGIFLNIVVGIVGAFLGGYIFSFFGGQEVTGFNLYSLAVAIFGSVVFIGLVKILRG